MGKRLTRTAIALLPCLTAGSAWAAAGAGPPAEQALGDMASFLLLLGLLMAAARLGGLLFERLRLPSTLGELAAGFALGPALLGRLPLPGFPDGLRAVAERFLAPGGALMAIMLCALMALLFLVGLETDVRLTPRRRPTGTWIGLGGSLGALAAAGAVVRFGGRLLPGDGPGLDCPAGLYLCVAAAFSSVGIAARSLARLRRLESPEGVGIMSAAVADNLAGVLWLSVAAGFATAAATREAGQGCSLAAGAVWRGAAVLLPGCAAALLLARGMGRLGGELKHPAGAATLALALALLAAGIFGRAGVSPLAGAYLAGLALAGSDWRHAIQERMEFMHAAFVPSCFALLGMCFSPRALLEPGVWLFAALFVAAAIAGKLAGCLLPAHLAGFSGRGCLRVGIGLTPRGEMSLAVAAMAFFSGVWRDAALAAAMLLLFVTGLPAAPLLRRVFRGAGSGLRDVFPAQARQLSFDFPSHTASKMMVTRLIDVLEEEGFHIQLLNRRALIYQLSREGVVLGLRPEGTQMVVDCAAADQPLVNSAMIEVLAGVERHLRELRRPLNAAELRKGVLQESVKTPVAGLSLKDLLTVNTLRPRLLADNKAAAITELIEMLDDDGLVQDRHDALNAVIAREEGLSTGLEHGLAMPHARTAAVNRLVCAIGMKQEGLDFGTLDGSPARIIILLLAPLETPAPQLQAIAMLSRILNEQGRAALLACDTAEDMYAVLTEAGGASARQAPRAANALACLPWHSIGLDLHGVTKEEILDQMLALCLRSGAIGNLEAVRRDILARERKASTGLEHGIALPHVRTDAVDRMVCALGISRAGVDFGALDGELSHIFLMVLMPPDTTSEYTRLTASIMRALDENGRRELLAAKSGQEAHAILARGETKEKGRG